ncbi:MAG: orotidine 5'-phosphate decarboxylase, partial [Peptococcaceae bacterium]|nr:orotidine 5'-phosphate decarboxylase [Peptococcaceae bacterium]
LNLAGLCKTSGMSGIVCSPHEAANIKETYGRDFITVCPGIRPAWAAAGDQKRITTPADAIRIGVDHMVVGRPITKAENPHEAALKIIEEINSAMK